MVTLDAILASLARLEAGQMNLCSAMDLLSQGQARLAAQVAEMFEKLVVRITDCSNYEYAKLEGLHDAMALFSENEDKLTLKLDAGLKGTADGVALALSDARDEITKCSALNFDSQRKYLDRAIAELRKDLLGTPQRGRKHGYRSKKNSLTGKCRAK